jgi:hydrogenase maturation protease
MSRRLLVAGIGNIFQTDDGFGVEVAARLAGLDPIPGVRFEDFGIRGVHLAYELLEGYDALILIDAVPMNEPPGTLAVIEPDAVPGVVTTEGGAAALDAHTMSPEVVLATLARLGGSLDRVLVLGCQPADLNDGMGLTPAVAGMIDTAVALCLELVAELMQTAGKGAPS